MQREFTKIEECIMSDRRPSARLRLFSNEQWFKSFPFSLLLEEKNTNQSPVYHPEGSVWEHTLMVVDEAAARKAYSPNPRALMWAALLHDIGKPITTKIRKGRITAYNHDIRGAELARIFLSSLTDEAELIEIAVRLVRYHMHILYVNKSLPFSDLRNMKERADIRDVALLGYCDRLGRRGADPQAERAAVIAFLQKCGEKSDLPWLRNS
ncbi:MAG: HDIG domain-containing metalloprotein [Oscillospiraceae bacterium]|jgi:tRNA nucleotidyltransferase (CCA-adding enzyme)